jgi:hypothetical protein
MRVGGPGLLFGLENQGMAPIFKIADLETSAFGATVDASGVCRPPEADKVSGSTDADFVSPKDIWVSCGYSVGGAGTRGSVHTYATTDGGKTWRPLLGQP